MKAVDIDARRYAWTRGQALWRMAMPVPALLEDAAGAADGDQLGLMRHTARGVGRTCAVVLALVEYDARPIPSARVQPTWALEIIADHPLATACEVLILGDASLTIDGLLARCRALTTQVERIAGSTPDPMSPEGYFPAMARAREWLKLAEAVGEESFLPAEWTGALSS